MDDHLLSAAHDSDFGDMTIRNAQSVVQPIFFFIQLPCLEMASFSRRNRNNCTSSDTLVQVVNTQGLVAANIGTRNHGFYDEK